MEDTRRNVKPEDISNKSLIEKYNCLQYYEKVKDCLRINGEHPKLCDESFEKLGECIYLNMKNEI